MKKQKGKNARSEKSRRIPFEWTGLEREKKEVFIVGRERERMSGKFCKIETA